MELIRRISLSLIVVIISFGSLAQERRLIFQEKLVLQEREERKQLEQMIETASHEEYRIYLDTQLSSAMRSSETNKATVIIDITDLSSTPVTTKETAGKTLGVIKLESLMDPTTSSKTKDALPSSLKMDVLKKQWEFSNKAGTQQFEQINVELGSVAIETLLKSPDVKDIFITSGSEYGNKYSSINTELGRFYPPAIPKTYDDDFLRNAYLDDIMAVLEKEETLRLSVTLNGFPKDKFLSQEGYFLSDKEYADGKQLTEDVLSDLNAGDYEVLSKNPYGFVIAAGKVVVDQLSKDSRVDVISEPIR